MATAEAAALAKSPRGAMIAAAGCGKTRIIAESVADHGGGRELILTHTHAGVDALRRRLATFHVPAKAFHLDTIAGWALRIATAFPKTSALPTPQPRSSAEYTAVYTAAAYLLGSSPLRDILRSSYSGVYVDEYQDCTVEQHALVVALFDTLPCRIVGDPLQGIFAFGENNAIRWDEHVRSSFEELPGPTIPHRWMDSNPALGLWLMDVRATLARGDSVDLHGAPVRWVDGSDPKWKQRNQRDACLDAGSTEGETVIAVHQWPQQCHDIARRLNGIYSCLEAIDTRDLYDFADRVNASSGLARAVAVLDFAGICMTKVKTELKTIRQSLLKHRVPRARRHLPQLRALLEVVDDDSMTAVAATLRTLAELPGAFVFRRELRREMERAVNAVAVGEATDLSDAAWLIRNRARARGRVLPRCAVGTTLLVKGLEFHHAVVLDTDGYDAPNLYVAITRASRSLTIVSRSRFIEPRVDANANRD